MSKLRRLLIVPPVIAGGLLVYFAIANRDQPERTLPKEAATAVRIITVEPQAFVPRVTGYGTVEPARTWDGIAQVAGRVIFVDKQFIRGGFVGKDAVLVRLATEDYQLEIAEANASIDGAKADIEELKLTRETKNLSLKIEKQALALEEAELVRQQELLNRGVATEKTIEKQKLAVLQQKSGVQDLENELALIPAKLRALEQVKAKAEVGLGIAKLNLERTVILAPFDARVAQADVEIDQYIAVGGKIGSLDGIEAAEINVQITPAQMAEFAGLAFKGRMPERGDIRQISINFEKLTAIVSVGFAEAGAKWTAKVKRISDTADPDTRSIGVIVSVPDPYGGLKPGAKPPLLKGMFTEVELRAPSVDNLILLPRSAVVNGRVKIADSENRLRFLDVKVAFRAGDIVVLRDGIAAGTKVIVSDLSPAIEGMLLAPVVDKVVAERLAQSSQPPAGKAKANAGNGARRQ